MLDELAGALVPATVGGDAVVDQFDAEVVGGFGGEHYTAVAGLDVGGGGHGFPFGCQGPVGRRAL